MGGVPSGWWDVQYIVLISLTHLPASLSSLLREERQLADQCVTAHARVYWCLPLVCHPTFPTTEPYSPCFYVVRDPGGFVKQYAVHRLGLPPFSPFFTSRTRGCQDSRSGYLLWFATGEDCRVVVRVRVRVCDIGDGGVREEGLLTGRQASRQGREGWG